MKSNRALLSVSLLMAALSFANASSVLPLTMAELVAASDAICRAKVVSAFCERQADGLIYTRTSLRVNEALKGRFPAIVMVAHRGGRVGDEDDFFGGSPVFHADGDYVLFLSRRANGTLFCLQGPPSAQRLKKLAGTTQFDETAVQLLTGVRALTDNGQIPGADVTDQAGQDGISLNSVTPSGLLEDTNGISSRFLAPDRGEAIPYLIDADHLPSGITLTQATNEVASAFAAWAAVTKLKFEFAGFQSFGTNADAVAINDEKIRIQLHDDYNAINSATTLAFGGRNSLSSPLPGAGWDLGGKVNDVEFYKSARGYVVMERTNATLGNLSNFTEVLCHEIGHVLSMAHSSETPGETNTLLQLAMMYYAIHGGGRSATLGDYDPPIIQKAYPSNNTPPYTYARVMDVVTASPAPSVSGVNEVELRGCDLQTTNLTLLLTNDAALNGTFSQIGNRTRFVPGGYYGDTARFDPAGSGYRGLVFARFSDGTNASPYVRLKVVSFSADSSPSTSDGIPDNWMINYFGNANPATGSNHRATNDFDGDGLNNLREFIAGTSPTSSASAQKITLLATNAISWQAKAYELYEVLASTNLVNWSRIGNPIQPTNAPIEVRTNLFTTNITATVSNLPVTGPQTFFRVQKVP